MKRGITNRLLRDGPLRRRGVEAPEEVSV